MDEGFDPDTIWIWDTCFMAHFSKYAPDLFPGVESFDNFYRPMYDAEPTSLKIHAPTIRRCSPGPRRSTSATPATWTRVRWLLATRPTCSSTSRSSRAGHPGR